MSDSSDASDNELPLFNNSDSEDDVKSKNVGFKRARIDPLQISDQSSSSAGKKAIFKNNIWGDLIVEQSISETLGRKTALPVNSNRDDDFVKHLKLYRQKAHQFQREMLDNELESYQSRSDFIDDTYDPEKEGKTFSAFNSNGKNQLADDSAASHGKRKNGHSKNQTRKFRGRSHQGNRGNRKVIGGDYLKHYTFVDEDPPEKVGVLIARSLREPKITFIKEMVCIIGCKAAIEFYERTLKIESSGGMMTVKMDRRRSPGGVFITLVKDDIELPEEMRKNLDILFDSDRLQSQLSIKNAGKDSLRNRFPNVVVMDQKSMDVDGVDKPDLLKQLPDAKEVFFQNSFQTKKVDKDVEKPTSDDMDEGECPASPEPVM